jgi:hypothetical protein
VAYVVGGSARYSHKETPMATNDPTPIPQFNRQNVTAALVIATLSAGALACVLYAPRWPIPCAIIGLFITAFAAVLHITLVTTSVVQLVPGQSGERAQLVELPIVKGVVTPVAPTDPPRPEQSSDHVAATVQRDAGGRFAGHRLAPPEEEP